jgi:hypothetical protein
MNQAGNDRRITRRSNMALDAYGKRFCEVKFVQHDRPDINRRAQEVQLIGTDGFARDLTGSKLPNKVVFYPPSSEDSRSVAQIFLDEPVGPNRPMIAMVEIRPRWPRNRDILHMAIPLVALGLMRLMTAVASYHP